MIANENKKHSGFNQDIPRTGSRETNLLPHCQKSGRRLTNKVVPFTRVENKTHSIVLIYCNEVNEFFLYRQHFITRKILRAEKC